MSSERGVVVWLTGLPSSGKSTLAQRVKHALRAKGMCSCVLDGDAVRDVLSPRPGYSPEERDAFYASLAGLAALLADDGSTVVVAATASRRMFRDRAKTLAPRFIEVFVDVAPEECARRDAKGLFAAARGGLVEGLPGFDAAYEVPGTPDVRARGGYDTEALSAIVAAICST